MVIVFVKIIRCHEGGVKVAAVLFYDVVSQLHKAVFVESMAIW